MASATNNALMMALTKQNTGPGLLSDNLFVGAGQTTQATATVVMRSGWNRIQSCIVGGAVVLPAILNQDEGADIVYVINDSANAVLVFCALGDTMAGTLNGSQSVAAGGFGMFLRRPPVNSLPQQSVAAGGTYDWRPAVGT